MAYRFVVYGQLVASVDDAAAVVVVILAKADEKAEPFDRFGSPTNWIARHRAEVLDELDCCQSSLATTQFLSLFLLLSLSITLSFSLWLRVRCDIVAT